MRRSLVRSLRFRITSVSVLAVALLLAVSSVVVVQFVEHHLLAEVDRNLRDSANYVVGALRGHRVLPIDAPSGAFGEVVGADGRLVGTSTNLRGLPPLVALPLPQSTRIFTHRYPRLGLLRVLEQRIGPGASPTLVEAQQVNQVADASRSVTLLLGIGDPLLCLALGVLVWIVVGRAMRPVEIIRREVAGIAGADLSTRLPAPGTADELDRLVETMNAMLERLQGSIERERRFIEDASHELRSPIAAAQALLEAAGSDPSMRTEAHHKALSSLQRLHGLAEDLLALSATAAPRRDRPIDVDELVLIQVADLRRKTTLEIDASGVSGAQVIGDERDLFRVIENLSSNAVRHATSKVVFALHEEGADVVLTVCDDGPGVPSDERIAIFDRFSRLDDDRNRTSGGAGLGLAIVNDVVTRYGGTVFVEDGPDRGARFVVRLPASMSARAQEAVT
jgi:signal transduction histidine kinase